MQRGEVGTAVYACMSGRQLSGEHQDSTLCEVGGEGGG